MYPQSQCIDFSEKFQYYLLSEVRQVDKQTYCFQGVVVMLKKVLGKRLYEEVVGQIRNLMISKSLKPGDFLPPETEISKQLGVSRTTVREALRILEITGLVETKRGKGTVVTSFDVGSIKKKISDVLIQPGREFNDLMETRLLLEPEVARLAAIHTSEDSIEKLEDILGEIEKDIAAGGVGVEFSIQFHHQVIHSIDNEILSSLTSLVMELVENTTHMNLHIPGRANVSLSEHKKILEAIKKGDSKRAYEYMKEHLESVKHNLETMIGEKPVNNNSEV